MPDSTTPTVTRSMAPAPPRPEGVQGWLLVLCLMLTLIGPAISAGLMAGEYAAVAPDFAAAPGLETTLLVSLAMTACAVAFGAYAGLQLWRVRPNAVRTAKRALLLGLAVDVLTTTLGIAAGHVPAGDTGLLRSTLIHALPSLLFFTLCFAYLNKSSRVEATYRPRAAGG